MANVDGVWNCVAKTPMGDQQSVLTVKSDGGSFTGSNVGAMGAVDITGGIVEGDKLSWKMDIKSPMPMTLDCSATISGDTLDGGITAGAFGTFPMTGTRQG
jgi:hypothetical protein